MLEMKLRAVDRVFARHPKSYMLCEGCLIHEAEVRAIWATPIYALSGAQVEWIVLQTGHFDNDAIRYYWPAILAHLVREPFYGEWWEALFTRLYTCGPQFTSAERQAIEAVLFDLLAEHTVQPREQAIIAAFLAFWIDDLDLVAELLTESADLERYSGRASDLRRAGRTGAALESGPVTPDPARTARGVAGALHAVGGPAR